MGLGADKVDVRWPEPQSDRSKSGQRSDQPTRSETLETGNEISGRLVLLN